MFTCQSSTCHSLSVSQNRMFDIDCIFISGSLTTFVLCIYETSSNQTLVKWVKKIRKTKTMVNQTWQMNHQIWNIGKKKLTHKEFETLLQFSLRILVTNCSIMRLMSKIIWTVKHPKQKVEAYLRKTFKTSTCITATPNY